MVQIDAIKDPDDVAAHAKAGSYEGAAAESATTPVAPGVLATAADLGNWDFEAPIAGLVSAERYELSEAYRPAGQAAGAKAEGLVTAEARLFVMLSAVTGMHLKAHEREEPFGRCWQWLTAGARQSQRISVKGISICSRTWQCGRPAPCFARGWRTWPGCSTESAGSWAASRSRPMSTRSRRPRPGR